MLDHMLDYKIICLITTTLKLSFFFLHELQQTSNYQKGHSQLGKKPFYPNKEKREKPVELLMPKIS